MGKTMEDFAKEGHSAFPSHDSAYSSAGMTLRDYFAAKAMQAVVSAEYASAFGPVTWAEHAYKLADAMLAERAK